VKSLIARRTVQFKQGQSLLHGRQRVGISSIYRYATLQRAAGNVPDHCPDSKNSPQLAPSSSQNGIDRISMVRLDNQLLVPLSPAPPSPLFLRINQTQHPFPLFFCANQSTHATQPLRFQLVPSSVFASEQTEDRWATTTRTPMSACPRLKVKRIHVVFNFCVLWFIHCLPRRHFADWSMFAALK
jgi:hypothetical protein